MNLKELIAFYDQRANETGFAAVREADKRYSVYHPAVRHLNERARVFKETADMLRNWLIAGELAKSADAVSRLVKLLNAAPVSPSPNLSEHWDAIRKAEGIPAFVADPSIVINKKPAEAAFHAGEAIVPGKLYAIEIGMGQGESLAFKGTIGPVPKVNDMGDRAPLTFEQNTAWRDAAGIKPEDDFFKSRQDIENKQLRRLYHDGFKSGWNVRGELGTTPREGDAGRYEREASDLHFGVVNPRIDCEQARHVFMSAWMAGWDARFEVAA